MPPLFTKRLTCPACTLLCDDVDVSELEAVDCPKAQSFFQIEVAKDFVHHVDGKPAGLESSIQAAVELLQHSRAPLVCGLENLTTQSQQVAWKIAERSRATLDTTMTNGGRGSIFSLQRTGKVTATLGEMANRSDVIVCWFCDPVKTHPRLLERLSKPGVSNRRILVIDDSDTSKASRLGEHVYVERENAAAVLAILRALLVGIQIESDRILETTGLELSQLESLLDVITSAKYGSIIYGQLQGNSAFDLVTDSLTLLIRELNDKTRFVGMKLRTDLNAQSAENVLAWSSGYPFAVNFSRKYPRFNWLEYSAETVLSRGECDAVLLATGVDWQSSVSGLSQAAREQLETIPTVAISPVGNCPADISIQVGIPALSQTGEYCRNDDVSMPLRSVQKPEATTAESVLGAILTAIS